MLKKAIFITLLIVTSLAQGTDQVVEIDVVEPMILSARPRPYKEVFELENTNLESYFIELVQDDGNDIAIPYCEKKRRFAQFWCRLKKQWHLWSYRLNRIKSVEVILNHKKVVHKKEFNALVGQLTKPIHLKNKNDLKVIVRGSRFAKVNVRIYKKFSDPAPIAKFTSTIDATDPNLVSFDASSSSDNGQIESYQWDFGDGQTGSGVHTQHRYQDSGDYVVTLTVTDNYGVSSQVQSTVAIVSNHPPVAQITSNLTSGEVPVMALFDGSGSTDLDGDVLSYSWDFGDGTQSTDVMPAHLFQTVGSYTVTLIVTDPQGASSTASTTLDVLAVTIPPDPTTIAPPLVNGDGNNLLSSLTFLYTNDPPVQKSVISSIIDPRLISWVRGKVIDRNSQPVSGVKVSILNHPEFGYTYSRVDGMYDMVVNGGMTYVVDFTSASYLPLQRQVKVEKQTSVVNDDVVVTQLDPKVLSLQNNSPTAQLLVGSVSSDVDGERTGVLYVPANTTGSIILPNGGRQTVPTMSVRITEYTVGELGPKAMPGTLPPTTDYTYAMELSVDQAISQGSHRVEFDKPVSYYLDNFLNFPAGTLVPFGYYNTSSGEWEAKDDGIIVKVLAVNNGVAELDLDNSGTQNPSLLELFNINNEELRAIASKYATGDSFWRVQTTHFSSYDLNYLEHIINNNKPHDKDTGERPHDNKHKTCRSGGSFFELETQAFGERIPLFGSSFYLTYKSDRTPGYTENATINLDVSERFSLGTAETGVFSDLYVAGRKIRETITSSDPKQFKLYWNGRDAFGRTVNGLQHVQVETTSIEVSHQYLLRNLCPPGNYSDCISRCLPGYDRDCIERYLKSFLNYYSGDVAQGRNIAKESKRSIKHYYIGVLDWRTQGFGGWSLNIHHSFNPVANRLYRGDGTTRIEENQHINPIVNNCFQRIGGCETYKQPSGDGGPSINALIGTPKHMKQLKDGRLLIGESWSNRDKIRIVNLDQSIDTLVGLGNDSTSENISLADVQIENLGGIEQLPSGEIIFADKNRVRKISNNGYVTTIAGSKNLNTNSGDGSQANAAGIAPIKDLAVANDGSIYVATQNTVRKIFPDGSIVTYAGRDLSQNVDPDNLFLANEVDFENITAIAVSPDDELYIANTNNYPQLFSVIQSGMLFIRLGQNGEAKNTGDGELAQYASISSISDIKFDSENNIYLSRNDGQTGSGTIRKIGTDRNISSYLGITTKVGLGLQNTAGTYIRDYGSDPVHSIAIDPTNKVIFGEQFKVSKVDNLFAVAKVDGSYHIPSINGNELFIFDKNGRHLETRNTYTRSLKYKFNYNNNLLSSIVDGDGQLTTIVRDSEGHIEKFISKNGVETIFNTTNGYIVEMRTPNNEDYQFTYDPAGRMLTMNKPDNAYTETRFISGLLYEDKDALGGSSTLFRNIIENKTRVKTSEERSYSVQSSHFSQNFMTSIYTDENGSITTSVYEGANTGINRANISLYNQRMTTDPFLPGHLIIQDTLYKAGIEHYILRDRKVSYDDPLHPDSSEFTITDSYTENETYTTTSVYSSSNNQTTMTSPEGRVTKTQTDDQGRITQITTTGLHPVLMSYDNKGRLNQVKQGSRNTTFTYDSRGYLSSVTNALNQTVHYTNDANGQVIQQTLNDGRVIDFVYDRRSNLSGVKPPGKAWHNMSYNLQDLLITYDPPNLSGKMTSTHYQYNLDKDLIGIQRPDGRNITYNYSPQKRQVASIDTNEGVSYINYDPDSQQLASITSEDNVTLTLGYRGDLINSYDWGGGDSVSIYYDDRFIKYSDSVSGGGNLDGDGLPITHNWSMDFQYSAQNTLLENVTYGLFNGNPETYTYNLYGELTKYTYPLAGSHSLSYTRDELGRITAITENLASRSDSKTFTYDSTGRLVAASDSSGTTNYTYDSNSNIVSIAAPSGTLTATYDEQDRLIQFGSYTYNYNDFGELSSKTNSINSKKTSYNYDSFGNLKKVTLEDGTLITYTVDGLNRRVSRLVNGTDTQTYLYNSQLNLVRVRDVNGYVKDFAYGSKKHVPDLMRYDSKDYRIITDHLGSVREVWDSRGNIVQEMRYDAYGKVIYDSNPGFQPFGFAGGLYDHKTGLVRFGARDYDGTTGRWLSKDPGLFDGGDANLYGYAFNDPINFIDMEGEYAIAAPAVGIGGGIGIGIGGAIGIGAGIGIGICYAADCTSLGEHLGEGLYDLLNPNVHNEHTKNKRPSTRGKHEKGQSRQNRDRGGERGDRNRNYPRKKPPGWKGPWPPGNNNNNQCGAGY